MQRIIRTLKIVVKGRMSKTEEEETMCFSLSLSLLLRAMNRTNINEERHNEGQKKMDIYVTRVQGKRCSSRLHHHHQDDGNEFN